jgi:hypothetical protein
MLDTVKTSPTEHGKFEPLIEQLLKEPDSLFHAALYDWMRRGGEDMVR